MHKFTAFLILVCLFTGVAAAQQSDAKSKDKKTTKSEPAKMPEQKVTEPEKKPEAAPEADKEATEKDKDKEEHFDVTEVPPVVTHHQITVERQAAEVHGDHRTASP